MSYEPTTLVQWSWTHPPRCLSSVTAHALKGHEIAEEHEAFAHFALSCSCGERIWLVLGYLPEPDLMLSPLTLTCAKCGRSAEIFDIEKHGYDAEMKNGCCSRRAEGAPMRFRCPKCNSALFQATAVVSYQMEESELEVEEREKVQDLFDTFGLDLTCAQCGHETIVCDYECA